MRLAPAVRDVSAGTGTVLLPATLRDYAAEAGFPDFAVLPIEDFGLWRFYRLGTRVR